MFLALLDCDTLPAQLLHGHERLVNVSVLLDEEGTEVDGEPLRMEDMRGCLCEVCA